MGYRKLAISSLLILLVSGVFGVSACTNDARTALGANIFDARGIEQAQALPGWQQVNVNGFSDPQRVEVSALEVFNNYLYAGTTNLVAGARIFHSPDGSTWTPVTQPDLFHISVEALNGYSAGGALTGGNITIHK